MRLSIDHRHRVWGEVSRVIQLPASVVWGQMRDWQRFLTLDPLHRAVVSKPEDGNSMRITHRFLGIRVDRAGRLLRWRENEAFVVSDLSLRGVRVGFPHVCIYQVAHISPCASVLTIVVRGKWTATWIPRPLIRAWIWWILESTAAHIERDFYQFIRWRERSLVGRVRP